MILRLRVFGPPLVERDTGPLSGAAAQRKSLALLALLAGSGGTPVSRDRLFALLWPEADAGRAGHRLTQLLYALRRDLNDDALFLGSSELRLNPAVLSTDISHFTVALERGEFEAAVTLYQGPFLDGFFLDDAPEFERWAETERAELARRHRAALESLARACGQRGDLAGAAEWWRLLAAADPLNARVAVACMEALAATGDRAAALQHARAHERSVREELEVGVEPIVLEATERIRLPLAVAPATSPGGPSLAVLPFLDISPDHDHEYFSDGMTEELTNLLARVPGLRVACRTGAFALKGRNATPEEVGVRLRVEAFVEGSVRKVGDRIRVAAQLVDVATGYQRWSGTFDRTLENVFGLQEELSRAIVAALPLGAESSPALAVRPSTQVLEAYTLYLRGRYHALRRTPDSFRLAIEYFEQAVELDPGYALAHASLAECWMLMGFEEFGDLPPRVAMPTARAAADRALALDERLAEGHVWRGGVALLFEYDWPAAEAHLRRAIDLRPELPSAHTWHAMYLFVMGRAEEARVRVQRAVELDPLMLSIQSVVGQTLYFSHHFDEAIVRLRALLEIDPDMVRVHAWIARSCFMAGRLAEGLEVVEQAARRLGRHPMLLEQLGRGYALAGRPDAARAVLDELRRLGEQRPLSAWHEATIRGALGEEEAFRRALEGLLEQRSGRLAFIAAEPAHEHLRDRPWFQALVRKVHPPA